MNSASALIINKNVETELDSFVSDVEESFDKSLDTVVKHILENSDCDIVLLAGPSSSGKTTTAGKIVEKIQKSNRNAFRVSLDDFYLNREQIPMMPDGIRDFENVAALDIDLIHKVFSSLTENRCAEMPVFDFTTGKRSEITNRIELKKNDVLVVEGIHALNPLIAQGLGSNQVYKIYISVSTRITGSDGKVILNKRNLRLIRRMVRDFNHRACSVENTFMQWPGVMKGEDKYLFPFESNADVKINSFHAYEPCIFKESALEMLSQVNSDSVYFEQAQEIISSLEQFKSIKKEVLPEKSLLREFMS